MKSFNIKEAEYSNSRCGLTVYTIEETGLIVLNKDILSNSGFQMEAKRKKCKELA